MVELRNAAKQRLDFNLAEFHDWLLGYSSVSRAFIPDRD
jgi:uncharacterized protein (DUF885 family)